MAWSWQLGWSGSGAVAAGICYADEFVLVTGNQLDATQVEGVRVAYVDAVAMSSQGSGDVVAHSCCFKGYLTANGAEEPRGFNCLKESGVLRSYKYLKERRRDPFAAGGTQCEPGLSAAKDDCGSDARPGDGIGPEVVGVGRCLRIRRPSCSCCRENPVWRRRRRRRRLFLLTGVRATTFPSASITER